MPKSVQIAQLEKDEEGCAAVKEASDWIQRLEDGDQHMHILDPSPKCLCSKESEDLPVSGNAICRHCRELTSWSANTNRPYECKGPYECKQTKMTGTRHQRFSMHRTIFMLLFLLV